MDCHVVLLRCESGQQEQLAIVRLWIDLEWNHVGYCVTFDRFHVPLWKVGEYRLSRTP